MQQPQIGRDGREEMIWIVPVASASVTIFLIGQILGAGFDVAASDLAADYAWKVLKYLPFLLSVSVLVYLLGALFSRSSNPLGALGRTVAARFNSPFLVAGAIAPLVLMPIMFSGYGTLKIMLPHQLPFSWDDSLAAFDRALFFGSQPWEITHAVFGGAAVTIAIDRVYSIWVPFLGLAILAFSLYVPRYDRARFFLAFVAAWIVLGVPGAYLTSSAGPCYAALIGAATADEYAPLMARLHGISETHALLGAVQWQAVLWDAYANDRHGFGMGISAMPSLHNAIAVLYALSLSRFGRAAAIAGWTFAAIIFVGSIHLGWHYATDGLVAGGAMIVIWWAAGKYLDVSGYTAALARSVPREDRFPLPASI